MSGTSLDGLDIAHCSFKLNEGHYSFIINKATTLHYPDEWQEKLRFAHHRLPRDFAQIHNDFGTYIGEKCAHFIAEHKLTVDFIASHGHTVFHEPQSGFTTQIGAGSHIAASAGLETICDFRSTDVAFGGNGAPLVPIGDHLLFSEYDYCLNLGGIANISSVRNSNRIAHDICPVNLVLNYLSLKEGYSFDKAGQIGQSGKLLTRLFDELNNSPFYKIEGPKSLGREWIESVIIPILNSKKFAIKDLLHTFCHHIAFQIAQHLESGKIFITGGGAYNDFLIECFRKYFSSKIDIIIPDQQTIEFKEALIFAFLGVLRKEGKANCLASVTGAKKDSCGGAIYQP